MLVIDRKINYFACSTVHQSYKDIIETKICIESNELIHVEYFMVHLYINLFLTYLFQLIKY